MSSLSLRPLLSMGSVSKVLDRVAGEIVKAKFSHMCGVPGLPLGKFCHVSELEIAHTHIRDSTLANLSLMTNLHTLSVPAHYKMLSTLTWLTCLQVHDTCDLESLKGLTNLTSLGVRRMRTPSSYSVALPTVTSLCIREAQPKWFQYHLWPQLTSLSFRYMLWDDNSEGGGYLPSSKPEAISTLTNLTSLRFPCRIPPQVTYLTNLLSFRNLCPPNELTLTLDDVLAHFPNLTDLCHIDSPYGVAKLTRLSSLNYYDFFLNPLAHTSHLSLLTDLKKLKTTLYGLELETLPPSLTHLDHDKSLTDAQILTLTNLTSLKLNGRVEVPASITLLTSLTILKNTGFSPCDFEDLSCICYLTNLTRLDLGFHIIPDHLLKNLPKLKWVRRALPFEPGPKSDLDFVDILRPCAEEDMVDYP